MELRRYAAPAAFLLAATIAVVLIRSGLEPRGGGASAHTAPTVTRAVSAQRAQTHRRSRRPRFWTVRAGDTLGSIAARTHVTLAALRRLNPKVSPTSLYVGEKIRVE